ncbi:MAG: DUF4352 domain-containing protein [Bacteroidales bacterium]|nr:DUF4352 domain-containing protein [Bacteroidales bacterium]
MVAVDSVEITASFPEWLKKPDTAGQKRTYKQPDDGNVYVFVHLSVTEKNDLFIEMTERRLTKTHLVDDQGETYFSVQQEMSFNFLNTTYPKKESGFIIFEIPDDAAPVQLNYLYQYREDASEDQDIKIGQIGVELK